MSDLSDTIDNLTGELERYRDMHAETLIAHIDYCNRMAEHIRGITAERDALAARLDGISDSPLARAASSATQRMRALEAALNALLADLDSGKDIGDSVASAMYVLARRPASETDSVASEVLVCPDCGEHGGQHNRDFPHSDRELPDGMLADFGPDGFV